MSDQDRRIWEGVLLHLRSEHPAVCRHWFEELVPLGLHAGAFGVRADSLLHRDFLLRNALDAFNDAVGAATGQLIPVRILGPDDPWESGSENTRARSVPTQSVEPATAQSALHPSPAMHIGSERDRLGGPDALPINPDYGFEHFVQGPNNRLAHAASLAVADNPGHSYNPLFIHGDVGLGKTHLLQAVCLSLLENRPNLRMLYVSCDSFLTRFMTSVQSGKMVEFRHEFRDVDVLVIDDIHFLAKRDRTQEEFFHTFNSLYQANKQIILSSDAAPDEIPDLEARLVSRFNWGLVCKVEKPGYDTRVEILKRKALVRGFELPDEVAAEIARHIDTNIRELEGAITKLQIVASIEKRKIDLSLARETLAGLISQNTPQAPTIDQIINEVVTYFQIKRTEVLGKRKLRSIAFPRQIGMYIARETTSRSFEEIGVHFGGRDHTTVMHAYGKIKDLRGSTPDVDQAITAIADRLKLEV
ncbi:MAG: chromosomal replication initiator protein DnaA [Phycisphaerales bacterium]